MITIMPSLGGEGPSLLEACLELRPLLSEELPPMTVFETRQQDHLALRRLDLATLSLLQRRLPRLRDWSLPTFTLALRQVPPPACKYPRSPTSCRGGVWSAGKCIYISARLLHYKWR